MLVDTQSVHCDHPLWRAIGLLCAVWVSKGFHTTSSWLGSPHYSKKPTPERPLPAGATARLVLMQRRTARQLIF
jgi:hypothetical protein